MIQSFEFTDKKIINLYYYSYLNYYLIIIFYFYVCINKFILRKRKIMNNLFF